MDWELAGRLNLTSFSNKLIVANEGEDNITNVPQISDFHLDGLQSPSVILKKKKEKEKNYHKKSYQIWV